MKRLSGIYYFDVLKFIFCCVINNFFQALIKLLHLIREDIERERKSKTGLENLSKAIKQNPSFGSEDSQQTVSEKLYHVSIK